MLKCKHKFYTLLTSFLIILLVLINSSIHHLEGLLNDTKEVTNVDVPSVLLVAEMSGKYQQLLKQVLLAYQHDPLNPNSKSHDHNISIHLDSVKFLIGQLRSDFDKVKGLKHKHLHESELLEDMTTLLVSTTATIEIKVLAELSAGEFNKQTLMWFLQEQNESFAKVEDYIKGLYLHQGQEVADFAGLFKEHYDKISTLLFSVSILALILWVFVLYVFNYRFNSVIDSQRITSGICDLDGRTYTLRCSEKNVITFVETKL